MPVKFKETQKDRSGQIQNFYMKSTKTEELKEKLNSNCEPKLKQKIRNELVRRGHA
jgi:hypothetical protein|tara:strand:+ start:119 stop:286 length:168 start_codon:yes stop_codon:yes gene_type:complete